MVNYFIRFSVMGSRLWGCPRVFFVFYLTIYRVREGILLALARKITKKNRNDQTFGKKNGNFVKKSAFLSVFCVIKHKLALQNGLHRTLRWRCRKVVPA